MALLVCGGFAWRVLRQKAWAERDATRQMAWAVVAVILLHSMLEYPLWYGPFQMAFGICLVLTAYAAWDYRRISQIYPQPEARDAQYQSDTLGKIRGSWLFSAQVRFAELMVTPLSASSADWAFSTATRLLHYAPEPRVVEKLIESAVMLGRDEEALAFIARYRAAFPEEHSQWAKANAKVNAKPNSKPV